MAVRMAHLFHLSKLQSHQMKSFHFSFPNIIWEEILYRTCISHLWSHEFILSWKGFYLWREKGYYYLRHFFNLYVVLAFRTSGNHYRNSLDSSWLFKSCKCEFLCYFIYTKPLMNLFLFIFYNHVSKIFSHAKVFLVQFDYSSMLLWLDYIPQLQRCIVNRYTVYISWSA